MTAAGAGCLLGGLLKTLENLATMGLLVMGILLDHIRFWVIGACALNVELSIRRVYVWFTTWLIILRRMILAMIVKDLLLISVQELWFYHCDQGYGMGKNACVQAISTSQRHESGGIL